MIDATIALQTQGPADPLERYGKVLALKNAIQQGKSQDLAFQQQQIDFDDQQKLKKAYSDAAGDLVKTQENAMRAGVSPKLIINLKSSVLQQAKDMADLDDKKYTALKAKNEIVGGKLNAVLSAPPDQQPTVYQQARAELIQQGLVDPAHAPEQFPGAPALKSMFDQTRTGSQMLEMADKIRDAAFKDLETKAAEQNAATNKNRETRESDQVGFQNAISDLAGNPPANSAEYSARVGKLSPAVASRILQAVPVGQYDPAKSPAALRNISMTGEQQTQTGQAATNQANEQKYREVMKGLEQGRLNVAQADLELKKQKFGFDTNGGVSPRAQAIAKGDLDPQTVRSIIRSNPGIIDQVKKVDQGFDEANIENRYNTLKEFTNTSVGKAGGQALAINVLIHHADLYQQTAEALKNDSFRPGNSAYNAIAQAFGSAPPVDATLVARFLAGETGKVATGGVPAEGEINGILKSLSTSNSPDQIANAGKSLLQIASGRAAPLMEKVNQAKLQNVVQVLGPDAKAILKRNGFDPETMKPQAVGTGQTVSKAEVQSYADKNRISYADAEKHVISNGFTVK